MDTTFGLCIRDPCPIILIFIFMREKSCLEVVALYQRGYHDLQVCQVSINYLSYFQSYGNFSAIFCIFVTFLVPYLHIKTLQ